MPKLYALTNIVMPDDSLISPRRVFDATVEQAKQFDALNAARPATGEEIEDEKKLKAAEDGTSYFSADEMRAAEPTLTATAAPESIADNDPNAKPKGRAI